MSDIAINQTENEEQFPIGTVALSMTLAVIPLAVSVGLSYWILDGGTEAAETAVAASPTETAELDSSAPEPGIWKFAEDLVGTVSDQFAAASQIDIDFPGAALVTEQAESVPEEIETAEANSTVTQHSTEMPADTLEREGAETTNWAVGRVASNETSFAQEVLSAEETLPVPEPEAENLGSTKIEEDFEFAHRSEESDAPAVTHENALDGNVESEDDLSAQFNSVAALPVQEDTASMSAGQEAIEWSPISVTLSTELGTAPVYEVNQSLDFEVSTDKDGYVSCFYQDVDQQVYRIFPNENTPKSFRSAGESLRLPGPDADFAIVFNHPGVRERVACAAYAQDVDSFLPDDLAQVLSPLPVVDLEEMLRILEELAGEDFAAGRLDITVRP